jgi:hypothetical protein
MAQRIEFHIENYARYYGLSEEVARHELLTYGGIDYILIGNPYLGHATEDQIVRKLKSIVDRKRELRLSVGIVD